MKFDLVPTTIGILIFDDVEVLDFCGPFEVFSVTKVDGVAPFNVVTIAEKSSITARNGLVVSPTHLLDSAPPLEILLIPGGQGTRREILNSRLLEWLSPRVQDAKLVLSVCTGALLLAELGYLEGLEVTTHHNAHDLLLELEPKSIARFEQRYVDNGKFVLSAGISAGIDMSFHVVKRLLGLGAALATAQHMEYDLKPNLLETNS